MFTYDLAERHSVKVFPIEAESNIDFTVPNDIRPRTDRTHVRKPFDRCRRARAPPRPCDLGDGARSCDCMVCPARAHQGCLRCSMWTMPSFKQLAEHGGATRLGANERLAENAGPFAQFVPPHLRDRHAQTTRQERQKKAAARGGFKCARRIF